MAVQFEGGVVIGADSRTTTGSYIVPFFTALSSAYFDDNLPSGQSRHRQTYTCS